MAQLIITYWRDIPSQVSIGKGRKATKAMLAERFQEAIDMAAMRSGAAETDDYIAEWRRGDGQEVVGEPSEFLAQTLERLEAEYDQRALKELIDNGGHSGDHSSGKTA